MNRAIFGPIKMAISIIITIERRERTATQYTPHINKHIYEQPNGLCYFLRRQHQQPHQEQNQTQSELALDSLLL